MHIVNTSHYWPGSLAEIFISATAVNELFKLSLANTDVDTDVMPICVNRNVFSDSTESIIQQYKWMVVPNCLSDNPNIPHHNINLTIRRT